jgi:DNA/RNA-binding domain of Phe-tRNA-synthetase-like protein
VEKMQINVQIRASWKTTFPGAHAGILVIRNVDNPSNHPGLQASKQALIEKIRRQYSGMERSQLETIQNLHIYGEYYRKYRKTFHILLQLESVISGGKTIASGSALVDALFMAELDSLLLTAGHDLDQVQPPIQLTATMGDEVYNLMSGKVQQVKAGDMAFADSLGILSSIIYGPDLRTRILPFTRNVLFTTYAPAGIARQAVSDHLGAIQQYIRLFAANARTEMLEVLG